MKEWKQTKRRKAGLLPPEESLSVAPTGVLHATPDDNGVTVDSIDHVDSVGEGVVELPHELRAADLLSFLVTGVATDQARQEEICRKIPNDEITQAYLIIFSTFQFSCFSLAILAATRSL